MLTSGWYYVGSSFRQHGKHSALGQHGSLGSLGSGSHYNNQTEEHIFTISSDNLQLTQAKEKLVKSAK